MASRRGTIPDTGVYFVSPRLIASIAACLMLSGVSKSGSPTDRLITSRPWAFRSRAFWVTAMVAEGLTRARVSEMKAMACSLGIVIGAHLMEQGWARQQQ